MKRCPECLFIYPDSDSRCDFDNTPLVVAADAEIDAATAPSTPATQPIPAQPKPAKRTPRKRKLLVVTAIIFSCVALLAYFALTQRARRAAQTISTIGVPAGPIVRPPQTTPMIAPTPVEIASASPAPVEPPKPAAQRVVTAHANTSTMPVSTSGPGLGKKLGGKPVILLTSGGKIEADEVWRTKDGVWYRRDGIVTLLKQGRVKAIVNQ
jgi:hypothetical protein